MSNYDNTLTALKEFGWELVKNCNNALAFERYNSTIHQKEKVIIKYSYLNDPDIRIYMYTLSSLTSPMLYGCELQRFINIGEYYRDNLIQKREG